MDRITADAGQIYRSLDWGHGAVLLTLLSGWADWRGCPYRLPPACCGSDFWVNREREGEERDTFIIKLYWGTYNSLSLIAFLSWADPLKHPKSLASLYLQRQQQLSTTHRTIYQSGSSVKRVISTLMAHKSGPSTASFSGTSSSFQRGSGELQTGLGRALASCSPCWNVRDWWRCDL